MSEYLAMAGINKPAEFKPLTQREQNKFHLNSLINPALYIKAGFSGAIDLKNDKPEEWEEGASGYGKRFGNVLAQYGIQCTVTSAVERGQPPFRFRVRMVSGSGPVLLRRQLSGAP